MPINASNATLVTPENNIEDLEEIKALKLNSIRAGIESNAGMQHASAKKHLVMTGHQQLIQKLQTEALQLIPEVLARRYNAIPVSVTGNTMVVAMADPSDILTIDDFSVQSHKRVVPLKASGKEIQEAIDFSYKGFSEIKKQISSIQESNKAPSDELGPDIAFETPLVQVLKLIIDEAVKARASDIHIEPQEKKLRIRYRIDGTLQDVMSLPTELHMPLISRLKILSELNIADHFHAQDGQFTTETNQRKIEVRVATSPSVNGEVAVLRLLDKSVIALSLIELGMLHENLEKWENLLKVPSGMLLVSGPTGAGKTTTLYASLNSLDKLGRNIVTVEDPAEYRFDDIKQIQVNNQAGITFASGLRTILRLDPDVILIGELRDSETASMAVQAALIGHLVLSSIHANDTIGLIFRLLDLGVEPFIIASSVNGVLAQRMIRRICPSCKQTMAAPPAERLAYEKEMREKRDLFYYGKGCKACAFTGYVGRTGIFEVLTMTDKLRNMIMNGSSPSDIKAEAIKEGLGTMMHDGMQKVRLGITTPTEVLRMTYTAE